MRQTEVNVNSGQAAQPRLGCDLLVSEPEANLYGGNLRQ